MNPARGVVFQPAAASVLARSHHDRMRPVDVQIIGTELALRWDDGSESFIPLLTLRRHCPCAGCAGETDVMGNLHKGPDRPLTSRSSQLLKLESIGSYALQPIWADGHNTGLYTFEHLRRLGAMTG